MPARSRITSRTTTLLLVAAVHGLVLWACWRAQVPVAAEAETFTSIVFFAPAASPRAAVSSSSAMDRAQPRAHRTPRTRTPPPVLPGGHADATTAITLPATVPRAGIDWLGQLAGAADAALKKQKQARDQANAFLRKFILAPDPLNPGRTADSGFHWYDAGIHRIDTRASIPVLHLNDRCVMLAFIFPACRIGHIESRGDLFQNMLPYLDEHEATARPNDVP